MARLGRSRTVAMDPRGAGASDSPSPAQPSTLEGKVDVVAVLSANMSFKSTLFGGGRSAFIAMLAAATYP